MRLLIHAVANVVFICGWLNLFLHAAFDFENGPRDINTDIVTKVVPVRAVNLSTGPSCTEFRREQLCGDDIFRDYPKTRPQDINAEIVTKMVAMRAVDLSIGPFYTEFRRDVFCDDAAS